jgi:hypothetical protein
MNQNPDFSLSINRKKAVFGLLQPFSNIQVLKIVIPSHLGAASNWQAVAAKIHLDFEATNKDARIAPERNTIALINLIKDQIQPVLELQPPLLFPEGNSVHKTSREPFFDKMTVSLRPLDGTQLEKIQLLIEYIPDLTEEIPV